MAIQPIAYAPADFFVMLKRKIMKFKLLVVLLLLLFSTSGYCESRERSILGYIDDISFWLDIPDGWYQDPKVAAKYGAIFFLIPSGYQFDNAPAVIYSSSFKKKSAKEAMLRDEEAFKTNDPNVKISAPEIFKSAKGKNIIIRIFESKVLRSQPFEAIAYIEEKNITITVVVSVFEKNNFDIILPYFKKMLSTYELAGLKVIDEREHNK
jgi:hypothetical protein